MTAGPRLFLNSIQVPIAPTAGYVLTADAAGIASWQAPSAGSGAVFDGGNASATYSGGPVIDLGHAT